MRIFSSACVNLSLNSKLESNLGLVKIIRNLTVLITKNKPNTSRNVCNYHFVVGY